LLRLKCSATNAKKLFGGDAVSSAVKGMTLLTVLAVVIAVIILLVMCKSWIEPFLYLFAMGIAVIINYGTNIIFPSVSQITISIVCILQLALSMDYSFMLADRYRVNRETEPDKYKAMKSALSGSILSIFSSSVTTFVGMLALVFMSFTIGLDMGLILAKGVLISLICIFTILPGLLIMFDKLLEKTKKPIPHIRLGFLGKGQFKARYFILPFFVVLCAGSFFIRDGVTIQYTVPNQGIQGAFYSPSQMVVVYRNEDENEMTALQQEWIAENAGKEIQITSYAAAIKQYDIPLTQEQLLAVLAAPENAEIAAALSALGDPAVLLAPFFIGGQQISIYDLLTAVLAQYPNGTETLAGVKSQIDAWRSNLVGNNYSRLIIYTNLVDESRETFDFVGYLRADLPDNAYTVGGLPMAEELSAYFPTESIWISVLTAAAIYLVVAIAFRNIFIPLLLVAVIQTAVFLTMGLSFNSPIYFISTLIVNCILMGSTVDYGIFLTSLYKEAREKQNKSVRDSLIYALNNSIHTILTSSVIIVSMCGIVGLLDITGNYTINQILLILARGGLIAGILVLLVLPACIAAADRIICFKKWRTEKNQQQESASPTKKHKASAK
jgi:predicted RND superfamily exporter protein